MSQIRPVHSRSSKENESRHRALGNNFLSKESSKIRKYNNEIYVLNTVLWVKHNTPHHISLCSYIKFSATGEEMNSSIFEVEFASSDHPSVGVLFLR